MAVPWGAVWKTVSSWPAAIAATVRLWWPQIRIALAGLAGAFVQNLRQQNAIHEQNEKDTAEFESRKRRLRLDPDYREQLRRESGKPPSE